MEVQNWSRQVGKLLKIAMQYPEHYNYKCKLVEKLILKQITVLLYHAKKSETVKIHIPDNRSFVSFILLVWKKINKK